MVITMGAGLLDVKSSRQKLNTKSSTESELVALSDMCSRVIWCREFLIGQGMSPPPARVYQDNQSTMALIKRGSSASDRTRHVAIRYYWVKDRVEAKEIEVVYMPTEDMIADVMTKPLQGEAFKRLRDMLLNWTY
jgi:tagatose-1,6-bisphosphate aldolase non-catalytic subunit AgaZ/GatZ